MTTFTLLVTAAFTLVIVPCIAANVLRDLRRTTPGSAVTFTRATAAAA